MALSSSDYQKYKNRVQNVAQQDLYADINFQNAELFKKNINSQQIQQGLSYNTSQQTLKRQLNNNINRILYEQQGGLIGTSALKQMIQDQQQAGLAIAQTSNSYAQAQQQANMQLNQANLTEQQIQDQYTQQEANRAYQEDLQQNLDAEGKSNRISSAVFGSLGAIGAILSFIPPLAPLGLALDVVAGTGMIGTDIYNDIKNPSSGNITQTVLDTGLAGLSLIPGISALRGLTKVKNVKPLLLGYTEPGNIANPFINNITKNETTIALHNNMQGIPQLENEVALNTSKINKNTTSKIEQLKNISPKSIGKSLSKSIIGKSSFERSQLAQERFRNSTNNLIGARRILSATKSVTGTISRGVGRGVFLGGTHYITNNILNKYLSNDTTLDSTQLKWRQIFDELNIPNNLRPQGL